MIIFSSWVSSDKKLVLVNGVKGVASFFGGLYYATARIRMDFPSIGCLFDWEFLLLLQLEACAHPFFDELREPNTRLPNGRPLPPLFNFKQEVWICFFCQFVWMCMSISDCIQNDRNGFSNG